MKKMENGCRRGGVIDIGTGLGIWVKDRVVWSYFGSVLFMDALHTMDFW